MERNIPNMAKESSTRTTRLSGDLSKRYENYRDENDMTDAEAMRSLIRSSLDSRDSPGPADGWTVLERVLLTTASVLAAVALFLPLLFFTGVLGQTATVLAMAVYLTASAGLAAGVSHGLFRRTGPAVEAREVSG